MHLFLNLQKTSLQDDLINRVVLYLLEDDDIRVRQASAKCLARYGHMITSLPSMQGVSLFHCPYHKCVITDAASVLIRCPNVDSQAFLFHTPQKHVRPQMLSYFSHHLHFHFLSQFYSHSFCHSSVSIPNPIFIVILLLS